MKCSIKLDISKPQQKYLCVSYVITGLDSPELILNFPTWTPGSYLIREYQNQVTSIEICGDHNKKLSYEKINKCQWKVKTKNQKRLHLTYRVYANELKVRAAYTDHEFTYINPSSAFFHIDKMLDHPVDVSINAPSGWDLALAKRAKKGVYHYSDFDEMYDTPILAGKLHFENFTVKGTRYKMAFYGDHSGDYKKIAHDTGKVVQRSIQMFRHNPCREYVFLVMFIPGVYGGLEHSFSSANMYDGKLLKEPKEYERFISLLSHEHFHLWNIKRIRPSEFSQYDYMTEHYTEELWMAEGLTSYYDDHFVLRSGLYSGRKYLDVVAENISKLELNKAKEVQTVTESSFDAWIKYYRQDENSINTVTSYYIKGGLLTMIMDFRIIVATKGKRTFDDVMRGLYKLYRERPDDGVTRREFLDIVNEVSGKNLDRFFKDYFDGLKTVSWKKEFEPFGVDVKRISNKRNYLGVILKKSGGKVVVQGIAEDSPAYHGTLQAKDEIIAINGSRITAAGQLDDFLAEKKLCIIFSRHGRVYEESLTLKESSKSPYILKIKEKITSAQKRNLKKFLRA